MKRGVAGALLVRAPETCLVKSVYLLVKGVYLFSLNAAFAPRGLFFFVDADADRFCRLAGLARPSACGRAGAGLDGGGIATTRGP